jgi:hypothetical protein
MRSHNRGLVDDDLQLHKSDYCFAGLATMKFGRNGIRPFIFMMNRTIRIPRCVCEYVRVDVAVKVGKTANKLCLFFAKHISIPSWFVWLA